MRFKNPGPATSIVATSVRSTRRDDLDGDVARGATETLGEPHDAVRLVVAPLRRAKDRVGTDLERVERGLQP